MSSSRYARLMKLASVMNDANRTEGERKAAENLYSLIVNSSAYKVCELYDLTSGLNGSRSTFAVDL